MRKMPFSVVIRGRLLVCTAVYKLVLKEAGLVVGRLCRPAYRTVEPIVISLHF